MKKIGSLRERERVCACVSHSRASFSEVNSRAKEGAVAIIADDEISHTHKHLNEVAENCMFGERVCMMRAYTPAMYPCVCVRL